MLTQLTEHEQRLLAELEEALQFARPYGYEAKVKEITANLKAELGKLAEQLREDSITHDKWSYQSRVSILRYTQDGYRLGVAEAQGIAPSKVRFTQAQRQAANSAVAEQYRFWANFANEVKDKLADELLLTTAVDARAALYAGSVRSAANQAKLDEQGDKRLKWERHKDDSCVDCLRLDGQVKTAREWRAGGTWPGHNVRCSVHCGCRLHAL